MNKPLVVIGALAWLAGAASLLLPGMVIPHPGGVIVGLVGAVLIGVSARKKAVFIAVAAVPMLALFGYNYLQMRRMMEQWRISDEIGAQAKLVCDGKALPGAAAFSKSKPAPLLAFEQFSTLESWGPKPVGGKSPASLEELQLVLCVRTTKAPLEHCMYEGKAGEYNTRRYQWSLSGILYEAKTAQPVDAVTVTGSEPGPCPDKKAFGTTKDPDIQGGIPTINDPLVKAMLAKY